MFDELASRAETFLVETDDQSGSILAGFPWLADWGRQTMIAAPGLALATGRLGAVARVLNSFSSLRRDGLIPSHFSREEGEAEYDAIDASLWFILAVEWFGRVRRSPGRPSPLLGAVRAIVEAYRRGTRFHIGVDSDGLLAGGEPGRALTWMDAVVDEKPVTPRHGRAVEVNALWHAALKCAARLERLAGETGRARELESEAWHVAPPLQRDLLVRREGLPLRRHRPRWAGREPASEPDPGRVADRRTSCRPIARARSTGPFAAAC